MDPKQFPPNSNTKPVDPNEKPKVEKVTTGPVGRRKTPLGKKFLSTFIVGDTNSVFQYVLQDVIVPTMKDVITDIITTSIERMLYGEKARPGRGRSSSGGHTAYNRYSQSSAPNTWANRGRPGASPSRPAFSADYEEIILGTLDEANEVIDRMFDLCERFNQVTVRDLHDLVGIQSNFAQDRWGWTDIRGLRPTHVRGGYLIDLPRPISLD